GHSQGEIAAACVAGVLSLEDGAKVVALRSKALRRLSGLGAMAFLGAGPEQTEQLLARLRVDVVVAAVNGPASTVVSGPPDQVALVVTEAQEAGWRARLVDVDYASHSPQIDQLEDELTDALTGILPYESDVGFYSTVSATRIDPTILDTSYWVSNLREPVRFADTVRTLLNDGYRAFIEASPHPVLTLGLQETFEEAGVDAATVPTLRRDLGDRLQLVRAVAQAFTAGVQVDWTPLFPTDPIPAVVGLPTYAFQRQRYWLVPAVPGSGGPDDRLWNAIEGLDVKAVTRAVTKALGLGDDSRAAEDLGPALPLLSAWRRQHREQTVLDSWRYQVTWSPLPLAETAAPAGRWLVVVPAGHGDHPAVRATIEALPSASVHLVEAGDVDRDALGTELADLSVAEPPEGVLSLLALDERPHPGQPAVPAGLAATTALVQALGDAGIEAPLWCLTQGAVAVAAADPPPSPVQAQTWGLGRVAALEHPRRWGGLIDLPTTPDERTAARLVALLSPGQPEDQIALRATGAHVRRLHHAPAPGNGVAPWEPGGTTLITGGTGALGAHVARWLAERGAPHLLLAGRRGPDAPGAEELAAELTGLGSRVTLLACDVSDRDSVRALLDAVPADQPLDAVFHTAGLPENTAFTDLDLPHLGEVLRPKAHAAAHLHELTGHLDLSAFVLFSSGAASWGSGHQASYAAANAFLDTLAEHRRALGLAATSLAWGPWGQTGMAADESAVSYFGRRGLAPLEPGLAVKSLQYALDHHDTAVTIADIDWDRFPAGFTAQRPSRLITDLVRVEPPTAGQPDGDSGDHPLLRDLAGGTPAQQHHLLVRHVQTQAAAILGHPDPDAVPAGQPFQELGFDSLTAVELRNQLNASTGLKLPPTLVFDHPTPQELAARLRELLVEADITSEDRVLSDLDRWDAVCEPGAVDDAARRRIARRLELLAAKWGDGGRSTAHLELDTATADDIFDLISEEFGKA
ncbi:MAG: SDR family NAD(P)-dependent oxidoreductase, partial [Streptosporangiaceae bacterium]